LFHLPENKVISKKNLPVSIQDLERFIKYVSIKDKEECWEWTGTTDAHGYGIYSVKHFLIKAHRASFLFYYGEIDEALEVCHCCDNPSCVNPHHLWQGTQKDNNNDRDIKGRTRTGHLYGSNNTMSKLNEQDIIWIRDNYNPLIWSTRKLAKKFGVCQTNIRNILSYKSWRI
jgi:hypothetical protein